MTVAIGEHLRDKRNNNFSGQVIGFTRMGYIRLLHHSGCGIEAFPISQLDQWEVFDGRRKALQV